MRAQTCSQKIRLLGAVSFLVVSGLYLIAVTSTHWVNFAKEGYAGIFSECGAFYNTTYVNQTLSSLTTTTVSSTTTEDFDRDEENDDEICVPIALTDERGYIHATRLCVVLGGICYAFGLYLIKKEVCENKELFTGASWKLFLITLVPAAGAVLCQIGMDQYRQHSPNDTRYPAASLSWCLDVLTLAVYITPFSIILLYAPAISKKFRSSDRCGRPDRLLNVFRNCHRSDPPSRDVRRGSTREEHADDSRPVELTISIENTGVSEEGVGEFDDLTDNSARSSQADFPSSTRMHDTMPHGDEVFTISITDPAPAYESLAPRSDEVTLRPLPPPSYDEVMAGGYTLHPDGSPRPSSPLHRPPSVHLPPPGASTLDARLQPSCPPPTYDDSFV